MPDEVTLAALNVIQTVVLAYLAYKQRLITTARRRRRQRTRRPT